MCILHVQDSFCRIFLLLCFFSCRKTGRPFLIYLAQEYQRVISGRRRAFAVLEAGVIRQTG